MILTDVDGRQALPDFDEAGLLPHLIPTENGPVPRQSPYGCSLAMFRERFGTTPRRRELIDGLTAYRERVTETGLRIALQWVSGSIVERDAEPNDIDVVSFYWPPVGVSDQEAMKRFARTYNDLFEKAVSRRLYGCDPNFVLLTNHPIRMVRSTTYWMSLYSYSKVHGRSRGFVALAGCTGDASPSPEDGDIPE